MGEDGRKVALGTWVERRTSKLGAISNIGIATAASAAVREGLCKTTLEVVRLNK